MAIQAPEGTVDLLPDGARHWDHFRRTAFDIFSRYGYSPIETPVFEQTELFVRGICCLRPGVPGRTEHISVRSIIGRYLEHERIFVFGRGEAQEVFLGSGDLLERNTVRRIEAFAAVTDPEARAEVLEVLSAMRRDNRQAWIMQPDGSYLRPEGAGEPFVSQAYLHTYFAGRTIEKPAPPAPPQPRKKLPWWRRLWIWLKNN